MKLSEVIQVECVKANAFFEDKAMALCEIAALAAKSPMCHKIPEETILEALQDRETLGSTAFGNGVAIPHCKLKAIHSFLVGMISVPDGVDFESPDGKKVQLIVFIIAPTTDGSAHIRLLSSISQALQDAQAVRKMISAKSAKSLVESFIQTSESDIPVFEPGQKNLLSVTIQDQTVFEKVLGAFAGIENVSLTILDAQNAHQHIKAIALFAAVPDNDRPVFCKQINVIVERNLSNELIRRIESVTGRLSECSGILVTVQELTFCAGLLDS